MDEITLTVYLVGDDEDSAREGMPFDSIGTAREYQRDEGLAHIYSVNATIDFGSIAQVD